MPVKRPNLPSVEAYLAALAQTQRTALTRVVGAIRRGLPGAAESVPYGIPTFSIDGHAVLYCAAFTAHYAVYPATTTLVAALGDALAPYEYNGKGTIRFPLDRRVPTALITRIARLRAAEDAGHPRRRAAAKKR
jgi:uncharacterized protein YdhG (YjbR/CyaY superfamily)